MMTVPVDVLNVPGNVLPLHHDNKFFVLFYSNLRDFRFQKEWRQLERQRSIVPQNFNGEVQIDSIFFGILNFNTRT